MKIILRFILKIDMFSVRAKIKVHVMLSMIELIGNVHFVAFFLLQIMPIIFRIRFKSSDDIFMSKNIVD